MRKKPKSRVESMAETREKLIAAGVELFAEKGLDVPSLDQICERAGFTRGAFYVHFQDRDDFLVAVMSAVGARFLDMVFAAGDMAEEPVQVRTGSRPRTLVQGPAQARTGPRPRTVVQGGLATIAHRFVEAVTSGTYPLTQPAGVRPHQLIEACARSPKIRQQYLELVRASITRLGDVVLADQGAGRVRSDIEHEDVATLLLALIVGAQTFWDLGVAVDIPRLSLVTLKMLQ